LQLHAVGSCSTRALVRGGSTPWLRVVVFIAVS
jgi:hypothetical protein